jgi:hypothetical protein
MKMIKPTNINAKEIKQTDERLTSAEVGKLWAVYMGNSMSTCVLNYYLKNTEDQEIKNIVQQALNLSEEFLQRIIKIFEKENFPIPRGFREEEDVNLGAPRLFVDEFYLYYLKYVAKAGLSLYSTAIPLMIREDVREFILYCNKATISLLTSLNVTMEKMGYLIKPPFIPLPKKIEFVKKQTYLNGFLGDIRPLHALEIAHLHDNIENNVTSKALLNGFHQGAKDNQVRDFLQRGKEITTKHIEACSQQLTNDELPSHPLLDDLVTTSTVAPFSDKLMMFHKIDMFSMKIRTYANATSLNGRHDIGVMYAKFLTDIARYVQDGASIMINKGWMEQPPQTVDRDTLGSS